MLEPLIRWFKRLANTKEIRMVSGVTSRNSSPVTRRDLKNNGSLVQGWCSSRTR